MAQNNPFMDLPDAQAASFDNPFMAVPDAAPENSLAKYYGLGAGETPGIKALPDWVQKLHSYIDPMKSLGGLPGVVGMALPAGRGAVKAPSADTLHAVGNSDILAARNINAKIDGSKVAAWADNVMMGLRRRGMQPTSSSAPNTHTILSDLKQQGNPYFSDGQNLSVADYIDLRRALQSEAQKFSPASKYDQAAASAAIKRLDNLFDTTSRSNFVSGTPREIAQARRLVTTGRANQAAAFRSDTLTNKQAAAELQTRATHSGMNLDNKIRQKTTALINPDNARGTSLAQRQGYSPEEIAGMKRIVSGVPGANTARFVGNLMGGGGGLGAVVSGGLAGGGLAALSHDPAALIAGAAVPATGVAIKGIENALTKRAMTKLAESVRMRSPMGAAVQPGPYSPGSLIAKLLLASPQAYDKLGY